MPEVVLIKLKVSRSRAARTGFVYVAIDIDVC